MEMSGVGVGCREWSVGCMCGCWVCRCVVVLVHGCVRGCGVGVGRRCGVWVGSVVWAVMCGGCVFIGCVGVWLCWCVVVPVVVVWGWGW